MDGFFWLHIKKSAGQSARAALKPLYRETDRSKRPTSFIGAPREEWNDILNNYRVPLGAYQFRRTEFAKRFLFHDEWDAMMRVGFARNPIDRSVSMFNYLFNPYISRRKLGKYLKYLRRRTPMSFRTKLPLSQRGAFWVFLELLEWQEELRQRSSYQPLGLHFATHTNPMSADVLADDGTLNLSHLVRLESFERGIDLCYAEMGVKRPETSRNIVKNPTSSKGFQPTSEQRRRIEARFATDFELYENALVL